MKASNVLGRAALLAMAFIGEFTSAEAACNYSDPTVSLSIQSPGSAAGVQVSVARIHASVSAGNLQSGSSSNCSNFSSSSAYIYVGNRYIGNGSVNWNTAEVGDGRHLIRVDVTDSNGGRASAQQYIEVRNNWIHPLVWNHHEYVRLNPDVANAFGGEPSRTLSHWLYYGIREGRQATRAFSSMEYMQSYGDLQAAFGANGPALVDHYIRHGVHEGRVGVFALRPEVWNVHYYYAIHPDLQAAFPGDVEALKRHWLEYGVNEGRRAKETFSAPNYLANHGDLRAAYGYNYREGIKHYIVYGIYEGRSGN